jgi:hypothetical protein
VGGRAQGRTYPEPFPANTVVVCVVEPLELVVKDKLVRDDTDLIPELTPGQGQRVDVQRAVCGLAACLAEFLDEDFLFLGCDLGVSEENDAPLRASSQRACQSGNNESLHKTAQRGELAFIGEDLADGEDRLSLFGVRSELCADRG